MNSLDLKIENALSAGTISIWYQPIYNRETNTFDAAEALMRLYDGEKMLPTFAAICRMEETGEIVRAGELVFEKVCCFIEKYEELVPPYIHVNLSCCQMRDMKNADSLIAIAKVHGVNPSGINLEITETTDCGEEGVLFVHKLLAEGFTDAAIQDKKAEAILNGVFHIAKSIHCEPVVEGIEDASQINREFLLGVRYFQGNAFAKAMPEQEYVQFLLNHRQAETRRGPKS